MEPWRQGRARPPALTPNPAVTQAPITTFFDPAWIGAWSCCAPGAKPSPVQAEASRPSPSCHHRKPVPAPASSAPRKTASCGRYHPGPGEARYIVPAAAAVNRPPTALISAQDRPMEGMHSCRSGRKRTPILAQPSLPIADSSPRPSQGGAFPFANRHEHRVRRAQEDGRPPPDGDGRHGVCKEIWRLGDSDRHPPRPRPAHARRRTGRRVRLTPRSAPGLPPPRRRRQRPRRRLPPDRRVPMPPPPPQPAPARAPDAP